MQKMNLAQFSKLREILNKYIDIKYKDVKPFDIDLDNDTYLKYFENATESTNDLYLANFILPDGRLRRYKVDLSDFVIPEIYKINFNVTNENIYSFMNLEHSQISCLGFDLDKLLSCGCIRIGNSKIDNEEVYLFMNLTHRLTKNILDIIEECLIEFKNVVISFIINSRTEIFSKYSLSDGNSIKDVIHDVNKYLAL